MQHSPRSEWWRSGTAVDGHYPSEAPARIELKVPISAVPFWGLLTFTFILLLAPQVWFPVLDSLRIALLAAVFTTTTYLMGQICNHRSLGLRSTEMRILYALVGWAVFSLPLSYWLGGSIDKLRYFCLNVLAIFYLLCNILDTRTKLRQIAWGLSVMAVPIAVAAVKQYLSGSSDSGVGAERISGYDSPLVGDPNDLALLLNLILPFSVALFMIHRKLVVRMILLVFIALDAIAIIFTYSRGGALTLAIIFLMYQWVFLKQCKYGVSIVAFFTIFLFIPFIPLSFIDRINTITDIGKDTTGSSEDRWRDMVAAMSIVSKNPIIGGGIGMDDLALNEERGAKWLHVHNTYLQLAVDLGIPGVSLFLYLFVVCVKGATFVKQQCYGMSTRRDLFYLAEGAFISLIAFAVGSMFLPVSYHLHFYYIAGFSIAIKKVYMSIYEYEK